MNSIKTDRPYCKVYHVISRLNYRDFYNMLDFCVDTNCESVEFTLVDTILVKQISYYFQRMSELGFIEQCEKVWSEARGNRYTR